MKIKCRAWDAEVEEFVYSDQDNDDVWFEFKDGTLKAFALHGMDAGSIDEPPQPICDELEPPEMFIGWYDKDGKEMFVGDITEIQAEDGKLNRFVIRFGVARRWMGTGWLVDIPSFYFDLIGGDFKAFPIVENYKGVHDLIMMKIIGNVYEHSDLQYRKGV